MNIYYPIIPRTQHPDKLAYDLRRGMGEFSVWFDLMFEKYLQKIDEAKKRVKDWYNQPKGLQCLAL